MLFNASKLQNSTIRIHMLIVEPRSMWPRLCHCFILRSFAIYLFLFEFYMLSQGFCHVFHVHQSTDLFNIVTNASGSAIVVKRNTPVVCFSISCLWPLWGVSLPALLQQAAINTFNVMCGQWNKEWFMLGWLLPKSDGICLEPGWVAGGGMVVQQPRATVKRFFFFFFSIVAPLLSLLSHSCIHLPNTPRSLTVPLNFSAVVLWD